MNEEMKEKIEELPTLGDFMTGNIQIESINKESEKFVKSFEDGIDKLSEDGEVGDRELEDEIAERILIECDTLVDSAVASYYIFRMILHVNMQGGITTEELQEELREDVETIEKLIQDIIQDRTVEEDTDE